MKTKDMTPVEVCDWVITLIEDTPDKFDMGEWMYKFENPKDPECPTVGCIAGWVGFLFDDHYGDLFTDNDKEFAIAENHWKFRQGDRLGLDPLAAELLFMTEEDRKAELMLRSCREYLADGGELIDEYQMSEYDDDAEAVIAKEEELVAAL